MLETLCRQQPQERAFRTELASVIARSKAAQQETRAFWSEALEKLAVENQQSRGADDDLEGGLTSVGELDALSTSSFAGGLLQWSALLTAVANYFQRLFLWLRLSLRQLST